MTVCRGLADTINDGAVPADVVNADAMRQRVRQKTVERNLGVLPKLENNTGAEDSICTTRTDSETPSIENEHRAVLLISNNVGPMWDKTPETKKALNPKKS